MLLCRGPRWRGRTSRRQLLHRSFRDAQLPRSQLIAIPSQIFVALCLHLLAVFQNHVSRSVMGIKAVLCAIRSSPFQRKPLPTRPRQNARSVPSPDPPAAEDRLSGRAEARYLTCVQAGNADWKWVPLRCRITTRCAYSDNLKEFRMPFKSFLRWLCFSRFRARNNVHYRMLMFHDRHTRERLLIYRYRYRTNDVFRKLLPTTTAVFSTKQ